MPVKISPLKILTDLGYEMVDIETDEDYLSALMESIVTLQRAGASGRARADILQEELIRVRKERKAAAPSAGMKVTQTKISASKFFDKGEQKSPVQGKSSQEKGGALVKIDNSVTSIVETLKENQKQDKKQQGWFRRMVERFKRRKKENKLEFKIFDGIKKTASKALAPLKSAWSKLLEFLGKVFLGRVLFKILEWMGNKKNQGKLKSIIKFLKDWWPSILAGYLLFGTGFTKMVAGIIKVVGWGIGKLTILIPKLIAAVGKLKIGKIMKGLGGLLGGGLLGKGKAFTGLFSMGAGAFAGGGLVEEVQHYKQGGFVSGPGGVDKVPARLTAGEFVMSKGAVQKYGANTLAAMNAAGGGTNKPTMGRYRTGGGVPDDGLGYGIPGDTRTYLPGKIDPNKKYHTGSGEMVVPEGALAYTGKEKEKKDAETLYWVNKEREFQGLPPLKKITYAEGVYLAKPKGPGPRTKEHTSSSDDFGTMTRTTSTSKWVEDKGTTITGEVSQLTEEDREEYFAKNPYARIARSIKNQAELDILGAEISDSAKMNGGGLVQGFQGGGLVTVKPGTINSYQDAIDAGIKVEDIVTGSGRFGSIRWLEKHPKGWFGKQKYTRRGTKWNLSGTGGAIDKELAMSTEDYVNMKMGWKVAGSQKTPPKLDRVTGDPGKRTAPKLDRGGNITSNEESKSDSISKGEAIYNKRGRIIGYKKTGETKPNLTPVDKKTTKVIDAYNKEKSKMEDKPIVENSVKEIPKFDALGGRSAQKIKVLGISV